MQMWDVIYILKDRVLKYQTYSYDVYTYVPPWEVY